MNYPNFNNHEISKIVAYSISEKNCEIARERLYEEFGKKLLLLEHLMTGQNDLGRLLVYYRSQAGQKQAQHKSQKKRSKKF